MAAHNIHTHWRDSSRIPRFFMIDARAALFVMLFLLHPRMWSGLLCLVILIILSILDYFKLPLPVTFRLIRSMISGSDKIRGNE
mgnify:CR=1 FL=1